MNPIITLCMLVSMLMAAFCSHINRKPTIISVLCPAVMTLGMLDVCFFHFVHPLISVLLIVAISTLEVFHVESGDKKVVSYRFVSSLCMAVLIIMMAHQHDSFLHQSGTEILSSVAHQHEATESMIDMPGMPENHAMYSSRFSGIEGESWIDSPVNLIVILMLILGAGLTCQLYISLKNSRESLIKKLSSFETSFIGLSLFLMII